LMVNLVFMPELLKETLSFREGYPVVPTISGSLERLQESMAKIIGNLEKVPFDQIGNDIQLVMGDARSLLKQVGDMAEKLGSGVTPLLEEAETTLQKANNLLGRLDRQTFPQAEATLAELQKTLIEVQQAMGVESPLQYDARKTLQEVTKTLRAFGDLMDTLDDKPESIIFGKEEGSHE
jgi:paraquat-inducible protein B